MGYLLSLCSAAECACICMFSGGLFSIQIQYSGGVYSPGEGSMAYSERFRSDHEDGTRKSTGIMFLPSRCH